MSPQPYNNEQAMQSGQFQMMEIRDFAGLNTRDHALGLDSDQMLSMQNLHIIGLGIEKRPGSILKGAVQTGDKVTGLGLLDQDSGETLMMTVNQTLYKFSGGSWVASDKTDYTAHLDTAIETFTSKGGNSLDTGTTSSGTTPYFIEDASKSWTPGEWEGKCVVINGEVKYISDNTEVLLYLSDKLNDDDASTYASVSYAIYELQPHAIIANGTDDIQKYDLTTTTALDGTHVTDGKALPKAKYLAQHQGRLFLARGNANNNDRVDITDVGVAENITVDTNLNFNTQFYNDGQAVQGIGSLPVGEGSVLLVTKERSVHTLDGDNVLNYRTHPRNRSIGCIAPKSLAIYGQNAFWLSDIGVVSLDTLGNALLDDPIPISRSIANQIDAKTDAERADACGAVHDNRYYLCIGSSAWYYDIEASLRQQKHVWVDLEYEYDFHIMKEISGVLYAGGSASGQAYTLDTGTQDNGKNITAILETGRISAPGRPVMWIERVELIAETDDTSVLRCNYALDGGSYQTGYKSLILDEDNNRYIWPIKKRCYDIKLKILENGNNAPVRIVPPIRIIYAISEYGEDGSKG